MAVWRKKDFNKEKGEWKKKKKKKKNLQSEDDKSRVQRALNKK